VIAGVPEVRPPSELPPRSERCDNKYTTDARIARTRRNLRPSRSAPPLPRIWFCSMGGGVRDVGAPIQREVGPTPTGRDPQRTSTWTVNPGDTLWGIAAAVTGDGERWRELAALNAAQLTSPGELQTGTVLLLPGDARVPRETGDRYARRPARSRRRRSAVQLAVRGPARNGPRRSSRHLAHDRKRAG
jgi:nucleoid-associated protein YgaU